MSASEGLALQALKAYGDHYVVNCCGAAATALLVFDYVLTLEEEVEYIWSSGNSLYVLLFFANRFAMLGMAVGSVLGMVPWYSIVSCTVVNWALAGFQIFTLLLWAVISTLRVYAVSNRDWGFTLLTLCLGLTPVATNLYVNIKAVFLPFAHFGTYTFCTSNIEYTLTLATSLEITTRSCLIASDALVVLIAWYQLHASITTVRLSVRSTLATVLLRDGTLYFAVLLLLNIAQVITDIDIGLIYNPLPYFTNPITAIIMSRFLLAVRRLALESQGSLPSYFSHSFDDSYADGQHARSRSGMSSMAFNSAVSQTAGDTSRFTMSVRHPPSELTESHAWSAVSGPELFDRWDPDEIVEMRRAHYTR
ncbi:hypothetical protein FOMPIDRAFT_1021627 [Fomitopsis schrenkii]|uniref:DUF6533 domain-containing protein n=1 Tax=Fomitopsis schrenkii TaxID=2126942 RepID=S8EP35_FOMSC|nr:hypothetical protein FOMPIDRAFT_1021627 [Fomitopsis schrenkii]